MGRASLKPDRLPDLPEPPEPISRPYGPGLIEAQCLPRSPAPRSRFPGPMGRASLKRVRCLGGAFSVLLISRPYGPGLIEAGEPRNRSYPPSMISRPYGPGLIEAKAKLSPRAIFWLISRPYGPGLIEASRLIGRELDQTGFPGPMGRASLKQVHDSPDPHEALRFPGPMGRASLKRSSWVCTSWAALGISRPYGPGLIEAGSPIPPHRAGPAGFPGPMGRASLKRRLRHRAA